LSKEWEEFVAGTTLKDAQRAEIASEIVTVVRSLWASNSKAGAPMIELMASARLATLTANALGLPVEIVKDKCKVGRRMVDAEKRFRLVAIADQDGKQFYDSFTPSVRRTLAGVRPADVVLGDVTPLDIPILRPDGTTGYARVIAWLDAATRFLYATLYLPNAGAGVRREHVAASFADMAQNSPFGLPKAPVFGQRQRIPVDEHDRRLGRACRVDAWRIWRCLGNGSLLTIMRRLGA